jgi:osmoprotectant transport system permease protein
VLATSVLCVLLAVALDLQLVGIQRALTPWTRKAARA